MKIAHIVRRFSFAEWGGTESVVWNIALQQKAQGLTPEILCTAALDKAGIEEKDGIKVFPAYFGPDDWRIPSDCTYEGDIIQPRKRRYHD